MTIDKLTKDLQQWRENKKSSREKIPEKFWQEAIKYAAQSKKPSMIAKKLGLNTNDLKKKMGTPVRKIKYKKKISFQELKLDKPEDRRPIVELTTLQGLTLKVYQ